MINDKIVLQYKVGKNYDGKKYDCFYYTINKSKVEKWQSAGPDASEVVKNVEKEKEDVNLKN